jgi:hypothetical protein
VVGNVCFVRRRSTSPTLLDLGPVYIPPAGQQVDKTQSDLGSSPVVTTILLPPELRHSSSTAELRRSLGIRATSAASASAVIVILRIFKIAQPLARIHLKPLSKYPVQIRNQTQSLAAMSDLTLAGSKTLSG